MRFTFPQKVLFKHCDPAGIVFYPRYFEMINDCIEAFFCEIGAPFETLHQTAAVPTAQISTTFHAPSRHGDPLVLDLFVDKIGRSSLDISLTGTTDTKSRFSAKSTLVYVTLADKSQAWPDAIRTALTPYLRSNQ